MAKQRINDDEREMWVANDEGLYHLFHQSKHKTESAFVRAHRKEIDEVIDNVTSGDKHPHYLAYNK